MIARGVPIILLFLSGCAVTWPTGSYVALQDDRDAAPLVQPLLDPLATAVERGQTLTLLPAQDESNMLTASLLADLERNGVKVVPTGGTHTAQYIATPVPGGEMLRLSIDGTHGGSQFFVRNTAGQLVPGGPFMEFQP